MFFEILIICSKMTTFIQKPANYVKEIAEGTPA
jgi:hypothetical protein